MGKWGVSHDGRFHALSAPRGSRAPGLAIGPPRYSPCRTPRVLCTLSIGIQGAIYRAWQSAEVRIDRIEGLGSPSPVKMSTEYSVQCTYLRSSHVRSAGTKSCTNARKRRHQIGRRIRSRDIHNDPPGREHLSRSEPRPKTWIPAISTLSVCDLGADSTCWPMQLWPKPDAVVKWGRMEPGVAMAVGDA